MVRRSGRGETPDNVVKLLKDAVKKNSQLAMSKILGVGVASVHRYVNGVGEPTQETLERLADHFGVSVGWLRGDVDALGKVEITAKCSRCGKNVAVLPERVVNENSIQITVVPCPACCRN